MSRISVGVAVDSAGNVYITDTGHFVIRKVLASNGTIVTIAGNGGYGYAGDGGPATNATFGDPVGVAVDSAGNVYFAAGTHIRKVLASTGTIVTIAGNGRYYDYGSIYSYNGEGGPATAATLRDPVGVAVDSAGSVYIADQSNHRILKVLASTGTIVTIAGNGHSGYYGYSGDGGPATAAMLNAPGGVALDNAGNVYIADTGNCRIRKVLASTGTIVTIAGNGDYGYSGDGVPATAAMLAYPTGVAVDSFGNVYIADVYNSRIRKVLASTGAIVSIAGNGNHGYSGKESPATAALASPAGVAVDSFGYVYIADVDSNCIFKVWDTNPSPPQPPYPPPSPPSPPYPPPSPPPPPYPPPPPPTAIFEKGDARTTIFYIVTVSTTSVIVIAILIITRPGLVESCQVIVSAGDFLTSVFYFFTANFYSEPLRWVILGIICLQIVPFLVSIETWPVPPVVKLGWAAWANAMFTKTDWGTITSVIHLPFEENNSPHKFIIYTIAWVSRPLAFCVWKLLLAAALPLGVMFALVFYWGIMLPLGLLVYLMKLTLVSGPRQAWCTAWAFPEEPRHCVDVTIQRMVLFEIYLAPAMFVCELANNVLANAWTPIAKVSAAWSAYNIVELAWTLCYYVLYKNKRVQDIPIDSIRPFMCSLIIWSTDAYTWCSTRFRMHRATVCPVSSSA